MRLRQTNSGNWAKQTTISAGGKWRFCGNFATLEKAETAAAVHSGLGRKVKITEMATSKTNAKKHGVAQGTIYFRLESYISRHREVMTHASEAECIAHGKTPGPCND